MRKKKKTTKKTLGGLVGWWRCETRDWSWQTGNNARQLPWQRATWKVESLDGGPQGRNSLFYFIFYTDAAEYFALPIGGRMCGAEETRELGGDGANDKHLSLMVTSKTGFHYPSCDTIVKKFA